MSKQLNLRDKTAHITDGVYRRMRASADTTKYVMAGMGALTLVLINLAGTLLASERGLLVDEATAIFAAGCVATICIVVGFARLYLQGSTEDEVIRFEVATKIGNSSGYDRARRYFSNRILKGVRSSLRVLLLVTGATAVLAALWAFYVIVF